MTSVHNRRFVRCLLLALLSGPLALVWMPETLFVGTAVVSLLGGLFGCGHLMQQPESRFNFFQLGAVAMVLASSLGSLFSYATLSIQQADLWELVVLYAHTSAADLALAQAYTNAFAIGFVLVGNRLQRTGLTTRLTQNVTTALTVHRRTVHLLIALLLVCQWYLLTIGAVVYGGRDLADETAPTHPLLAFVGPLAAVLPVALAYYLRQQYVGGRYGKAVLYSLLLVMDLGWFFLFGRRSVLFFFLLTALGLVLEQPLTYRLIIKNSIWIMLMAFLAFSVADAYHKVRVTYRFEGAQRMSLVEALSGLADVEEERYSAIRNRNVAMRSGYSSLALGQFINLFRTTAQAPLFGRQLRGSLLVATPSDYFVDKRAVLVKEHLYESAFNVPVTDVSETLCLESFIDFGWFGFIIYIGFVGLLIGPLYTIASSARYPVFSLIMACMAVSLALTMVETDLITVLIAFRSALVCYGFVFLFSRRKRAAN